MSQEPPSPNPYEAPPVAKNASPSIGAERPLLPDKPATGFRSAQWRMLLATMFCYLFFYTGRQTFGFAMPGIEKEFGVTKEALGWISTLLLWSYGLGQFVNGNLADRFGGRRMMTLGAVLSCATNWLLSFSGNLTQLGTAWGVNGYFQSLGWAPGSRLLSNWWAHHERGKVYGFYVFAAGMSSTLAFATSLLVIDTLQLDWRWVFRLPVLLLLCGAVVFYLVARDRPADLGYEPLEDDNLDDPSDDHKALNSDSTQDSGDEEAVWDRYLAVLSNWRVVATMFLITFQNAARYGLIVWVPVHFLGENFKSSENAWVAVALPFGMAWGALTNGVISDRVFGSRRSVVIVLYMALGAGMTLAMLVVPAGDFRIGVPLLFAAGFFVYGPAASIWALCPDLAGRRHAGTATGVVNFAAYAGAGLVEPLIGKIMDLLKTLRAKGDVSEEVLGPFVLWLDGLLQNHPPTLVIFPLVAILCALAAATGLLIRR